MGIQTEILKERPLQRWENFTFRCAKVRFLKWMAKDEALKYETWPNL